MEISYKQIGNKKIPYFPPVKAEPLTDDTPICTLQYLIDLLGEKRALSLYAWLKSGNKGLAPHNRNATTSPTTQNGAGCRIDE